MATGWTTVYVTNDEIDANLKKGLFENAGIDCVIESSIYRPRSVAPVYNQFKLNVPSDKAGEAKEIISELE